MEFGRIVLSATLLSALCGGLIGCGSTADNPAVPVGDATQTDGDENSPGTGDEEPLYGADPLVPAIQLDGGYAADRGSGGHIIASSDERPLPMAIGLNSGILTPDFTADPRAAFHPHGPQVCASGCATSNHATPELKYAKFQQLLEEYRPGPLDETNAALESLLYYGRQTSAFLRTSTALETSPSHDEFLRNELKKTHAYWSFRVVDEKGVVRVEMKRTRVPLDRRHVFEMDYQNLQPLVTSGTVKRVGLHHLWTRI